MSDFKFTCPYCQQSLEAPQDMLGTVIDCPSCNKRIQIPKPHPRGMSKIKCLFGNHQWEGCKCMSCGQVRDSQHLWSKCKCALCGKVRAVKESEHDWSGCKCSLCGETRDWGHEWGDAKCLKCGARLSTSETAKRWAQRLADAKDYASLAAYMLVYNFQSPDGVDLCNAKHSCAKEVLVKAGTDAIDAILEQIPKADGSNDYELAQILVKIGDVRAVPLLKRLDDTDKWSAYGCRSDITEFVNKFPQFHGPVEKVSCAVCGKVRLVTETRQCEDKRFCIETCWRKRGHVIRHGIGTGCPHYQEGVCVIGERDTGLCSLQEGNYRSSCNVYALHPA